MRKTMWLSINMILITLLLVGCNGNVTTIPEIRVSEAYFEDAQTDETVLQESPDDLTDYTDESNSSDNFDNSGSYDEANGSDDNNGAADPLEENIINEDGRYTDKDRVALYIHSFGKLPSNYITKNEAQKSGWNSKENSLNDVLPGMSIGGDRFGNYEELLPKKNGRTYKECDIDYEAGSRNAKRIVFSNDGLIFYTDDHYKSFEQIY